MRSSVRVRDWFLVLSFSPVAHWAIPLAVIRPNSVAGWIYDFIAVAVRCGRRNSDVLHLASRKAAPATFSVYYGRTVE